MHNACGLAVGRLKDSWLQSRVVIHRYSNQAASCAKNVFFSPAFAITLSAPVHKVCAKFQSVIARLYTVCTGLTTTTTIKLYVYKGECA